MRLDRGGGGSEPVTERTGVVRVLKLGAIGIKI